MPRIYRVYSDLDIEDVLRIIRSSIDLEGAIDAVKPIIEDVRRRGDDAVIEYARRLDGADLKPEEIYIDRSRLSDIASKADLGLVESLEKLSKRIENAERPLLSIISSIWRIEVREGLYIEVFFKPIERVACYIPGGFTPYVSTALMCGVTARIAGVKRLVALLPPKALTPGMAASLLIAGFDGVYRVGGPYGVAAVAYGTKRIERVDKIVGPGGIYVTAAKALVSRVVGIDMLAGPTELIIYIDRRGYEEEILLHLAAQAEHGDSVLLAVVTPDSEIANNLARITSERASNTGSKAFERVSRLLNIVIVDSVERAAKFIDTLSAEHVEICSNLEGLRDMLNSYGVLIDGCVSSAINDYYSGVNHILPTMSWARVRGGLSILDFVALRRRVIYRGSRDGLRDIASEVMPIAMEEGFQLHLDSIYRGVRG
ncbi:MAG: histidinol dehydrogenase [Sulfolobales archaeon]